MICPLCRLGNATVPEAANCVFNIALQSISAGAERHFTVATKVVELEGLQVFDDSAVSLPVAGFFRNSIWFANASSCVTRRSLSLSIGRQSGIKSFVSWLYSPSVNTYPLGVRIVEGPLVSTSKQISIIFGKLLYKALRFKLSFRWRSLDRVLLMLQGPEQRTQ